MAGSSNMTSMMMMMMMCMCMASCMMSMMGMGPFGGLFSGASSLFGGAGDLLGGAGKGAGKAASAVGSVLSGEAFEPSLERRADFGEAHQANCNKCQQTNWQGSLPAFGSTIPCSEIKADCM